MDEQSFVQGKLNEGKGSSHGYMLELQEARNVLHEQENGAFDLRLREIVDSRHELHRARREVVESNKSVIQEEMAASEMRGNIEQQRSALEAAHRAQRTAARRRSNGVCIWGNV